MGDVVDPGDVRGLDDAVVEAVALAEREARELGHDRVGTEHLLLGLLTNESDASTALTDAGVTLAAARDKVDEAVGVSPRPGRGSAPIPRTSRARRALGRAARFAHADGSDVVTSDHVLSGVLDVEGTAGQVLRGLGVDVDSLRAVVDARSARRTADASDESHAAAAGVGTCPSCQTRLDGHLTYRVVAATSDLGVRRDVVVFSCGICGRTLGVTQT